MPCTAALIGSKMEGADPCAAAGVEGSEDVMQAKKGDWLVVESAAIERHSRRGLVLNVVGPDGSPPFLVRWDDDGHESLVYPGPDAHIAAQGASSSN